MIKTDVVVIGAGPVGLFAVHQLGIIGLKAEIIDNLDKAGGQCIELYPDKPIYDIPGIPECTGEELTNKLLEQIKPFKTKFFLNERVDEVRQDNDNWFVKTNNNNEFISPYFGRTIKENEITEALKTYDSKIIYKKSNDTTKQAAQDVFNNKVIAWYEG